MKENNASQTRTESRFGYSSDTVKTEQPKQSVGSPTAFPLLPGDPGITLTNAIAFNNLQKTLFEIKKNSLWNWKNY